MIGDMFRLIHNQTGWVYSLTWSSYESADCFRMKLDDWMNWSIIRNDER